MKKNLLMAWVFLGIVSFAGGQEKTIEPGQQAKNYLNSKNASVDYATGIFNYRVPVHEIKVGDFTLPVTLDYAARGVKADDQPGAVGYNWNLNTGGVVTRQLRGGIADETQDRGFAYWVNMATSFAPVYEVYLGEIDGEADIFTVVFNGRSVNFIIRYQEGVYPYFFAIPLEPTQVKIKCLYASPSIILGWEITDEEGNKYVFEDEEWSSTTRAGTVETNSLKGVNYISSWYLSCVQPVNMPLISYEYYRNVGASTWYWDSIVSQSIYTRTTVDYCYGQPVIERPYDFSKYKERFDYELRLASQYFSWENAEIYNGRLQQNGLYNSLDDFYLNASLDEIFPERIIQNQYTMGVLYDLGFVNQAYKEVIDLLNDMIADCKRQSSSYYSRQAILHLDSAKAIVTRCREEVREVRQKDVYQFGCQEIKTPMLKKISWDSGELEFKYSKTYSESFLLDKIIVRDVNRDSVRSVRLTRYYPYVWLPNEISFHDRCGEKVSNILFDYYRMGTSRYMVNLYGYYLEYTGDGTDYWYINKQRFNSGWNDGILHNSLRGICVPGRAIMELKYECNTNNISLNGYSGNHVTGAGIRLSEIRIKDGVSGRTDKIQYAYPECGVYVYPKFTNLLVIDYPSGFQDVLVFDRLYNPGPDAIVKTGNNGVYYPRVAEYMLGKGRAEYYFATPDTSNVTCNYRATGNPLGICYYDERGKLKKAIRYEYDDTSALATRKYFYQVKPCEYFVDESKIERQYGDSLYFEDNLRPRLKPVLPSNPFYQIDYDYAVYLKRVTEYNFEGDVPYFNGPDYLRESPNYTRTEYDYDLSRSVFPVKTTVSGGDGIKQVEVVKRALDFDDGADASIPLLKAANMVGVPLKVQTFTVDADGTERLLSENVNTYVNFGSYSPIEMLQTEANECIYDGESVVRADSLFSFDRSKYDRTVLTYVKKGGWWQPVSAESLGNRTETRYDFVTGFPVLQVANALVNSVAACDYRRFKGMYYRPEMALTPAAAGKYRLWALTTASVPITLSITSGGTVSTRTFTAAAGCLGPQVFELELAVGVEKVSLTNPDANLVYIAIVPAGSEMEATSYNADGTVYCTFDHNGRAERYEYDAAGRVVKTYDRDGNLLKENSYNVVF